MKTVAEMIGMVCEKTHVPMVNSVFGSAGVDATFQIMEMVKRLYTHVEPERITGRVVIYKVIHTEGQAPATPPTGPVADLPGLANMPIADLVLEIGWNGEPYVRVQGEDPIEDLAEFAVVYQYSSGREEFMAGTKRMDVLRLDSSAHSQFCVPTLSSIREALQQYARDNVRESSCVVFRGVWFDDNRLFFNTKPEKTMRRSMTQFLQNRLGADHDVWPEQNVDESHPVDIRIQPRFSNNRLILIEIKWLGDSAKTDGQITVQYREARAQVGADQLAQYLEAQRQSASSRVIQGCYVIIDGRRKGLRRGVASISKTDGHYYEDAELILNPAHQEIRNDFDPPYRMFARPVCAT